MERLIEISGEQKHLDALRAVDETVVDVKPEQAERIADTKEGDVIELQTFTSDRLTMQAVKVIWKWTKDGVLKLRIKPSVYVR